MNLQDDIASLFARLETLRALPWSHKEALGNLISERVLLLQLKLRRSSYIPLQSGFDHLKVNSNFTSALTSWVSQFSLESQLGALSLGLSISYITEREMESFWDSCVAEFIGLQEDRSQSGAGTLEVVPYAVSDRTDIYGKFIHAIRQHGTSNPSVKTPGPLESFLLRAAQTVYFEAADQSLPGPGYYDLGILLDCVLSKHYVVIEDWALTGSTIATEIRDLLRLFKLLLGRKEVREYLQEAGFSTPTM